VGKTTLGLIAATSLRRSFIDCDAIFSTLHGPISNFVNSHGWSAFRDAETQILKKLLEDHPKDFVIACGGGVVEREVNRDLLKRFKGEGGTIVHVVRDKDETVRYLVDESARYVDQTLNVTVVADVSCSTQTFLGRRNSTCLGTKNPIL